MQAAGRISGDAADVSTFTARVADGTITGRGQASLAAGTGSIRLDWRLLDLATLMRQVLRDGIQLAARVDGSLDAQWSAPRLDALRVQTQARSIAPSGDTGRTPSIEGSIAVDLRQQRWTLRGEQTLDHSAHATAAIGGTLVQPDVSRSSLSGDLHVSARRRPSLGAGTRDSTSSSAIHGAARDRSR